MRGATITRADARADSRIAIDELAVLLRQPRRRLRRAVSRLRLCSLRGVRDDAVFTMAEAGFLLGVGRWTVRGFVREGRLAGERADREEGGTVWSIRLGDIRRLAAQLEVEGPR